MDDRRDERGESDVSLPATSVQGEVTIDDVADGVERHPDPRFLTLQKRRAWLHALRHTMTWLVVGGFAVVLGVAALRRDSPPGGLWLFAAWGVWAIGYTIWTQVKARLSYRHASYRVDAHTIEVRAGIFVRRLITVPRSRVQHIDIAQGPFERRHGIATLAIHTAGVTYAVVLVPGLDMARALRIRDHLLPREGDARR